MSLQTAVAAGDEHIRWMIRRDMARVLEIEQNCFANAWTEEDFIKCLRARNNIGMVVEDAGEIAGFMVYELHRKRLGLWNFAVHEDFRRQGVATAMISKLKKKLNAERRNRITVEVRETNVDAQLFFKAMGFIAISTLRNFFEDTDEDAYLMQYRFHPEVDS